MWMHTYVLPFDNDICSFIIPEISAITRSFLLTQMPLKGCQLSTHCKYHHPILFEPRCEKTGLRVFLTRSDTNQAVQLQKMTRGLKFCV